MYKRHISALILIILTSLLMGCSIANRSIDGDEPKPIDQDQLQIIESQDKNSDEKSNDGSKEEIDPLKEQIKSMSLDEKIGQMLIVGIDGYEMNEQAKKLIENNHIGGFILYGSNIKDRNQLLNLINTLKETNQANDVPLFISVDEEGGRVSRMPGEFKKLPTNQELGNINSSALSYEIGNFIAEEINSFGFNMNFAPVLDINSNPNNPVIGDRSFSSDKEIVEELGIATMKGMQRGGVVSVIKHFPGHGDTSVDSHINLPSVDSTLSRLVDFELLPFEEAIKNGADTIMIAHILMTNIDPSNPSSLSKTIITHILRKQLDFDGVVITDDMTMGAIVENYSLEDAAVKSVAAGSDIVLVAHGYDNEIAVINNLKEAVQAGVISEERIDTSVYRILELKNKYNLSDDIGSSVDVESINTRLDAIIDNYIH